MDDFIDILSRLIIATITFIGPTMIFTFGILYDAIMLSHNERKKMQNDIVDQATIDLNSPNINKVEIFKSHIKEFTSHTRIDKRFINFFLNPLVQIISIFSLLFFSLGCLMISYLVKDNVWDMRGSDDTFWGLLIWLTSLGYLMALFIIVIFVKNIVKIKVKIEKSKSNQ